MLRRVVHRSPIRSLRVIVHHEARLIGRLCGEMSRMLGSGGYTWGVRSVLTTLRRLLASSRSRLKVEVGFMPEPFLK